MRLGIALAVGTLLPGALASSGANAATGPDVLKYDLEVTIREKSLTVAVTLHAATPAPSPWTLELAPEMKVLSAEAAGKAVPFRTTDGGLVLDLSAGIGAADGEFAVSLRVEGSPLEEWRSRGFVRSAVRPEMVWIRSQYAWFPRSPDDPAAYRTVVDAPAGWEVRTAGNFTPPETKGARARWTFETAGPVDRAGLVAGPWQRKEVPAANGTVFDALFLRGHEKGTDALLRAARSAFDFFTSALGPISRPRFSLVEMPKEFGTSSGYGEHGYLLLCPAAFEEDPLWVPGGVAHEVAHNWWAHEVPFSDFASETLAEFSTLLFLRSSEGEEAARRMRQAAVERVAKAAAEGKEIAFSEIRGSGIGMDPEVYRLHAYEKGMMVLSMIERETGREPLRKAMGKFLEDHRGKRVGWADLRDAMANLGAGARTVLDQWEKPGIPSLRLDFESKKSAGGCTVTGRVIQEGTPKPFRMAVPVVAECGGKRLETTVKLAGAETAFSLKAPAEPETVALDPEWLLLASRSGKGPEDPAKAWAEASAVATNPGDADPEHLARALAQLRSLLDSGKTEHVGECHVDIGRLLFRQGKMDEAKDELEQGLRTGGFGPFTRSWAELRLGCIADLKKKRSEAASHYKAVLALPDANNLKFQKGKAQAFLDRPYRGYETDH